MTTKPKPELQPSRDRGAFPFPLAKGPNETPALVWVRGRANFIGAQGFLDYLRIPALLLRGMLINSLVLLPPLLLLGFALGLLYGTTLDHWDEADSPSTEVENAKYELWVAAWPKESETNRLEQAKSKIEEAKKKWQRQLLGAPFKFFLTRSVDARSFAAGDIVNVSNLVQAIHPTTGLAQTPPPGAKLGAWLFDRFSPRTTNLFAPTNLFAMYTNDTGQAARLKLALAEELNSLLRYYLLYEPERFRGVKLTDETKRLLSQSRADPQAEAFSSRSLLDLPSLALQLTQTNGYRACDRWLAGKLSTNCMVALVDCLGSEGGRAAAGDLLVRDLNRILLAGPLDQSFRDPNEVALRTEALHWPANGSSPGAAKDVIESIRLNRLLLEDAYPKNLSWLPTCTALASLNRHLLVDAFPGQFNFHTSILDWIQEKSGLAPPFLLTPLLAVMAVALILVYPMIVLVGRIAGFRQLHRTGGESLVKSRDLLERRFVRALLVVVVVVLCESIPLLVYYFHCLVLARERGELPWAGVAALATAVLGSLGFAPKLLERFSGVGRVCALGIVAALGVCLPLAVVVWVTDFLVYFSVPVVNDWLAWAGWGWLLGPPSLALLVMLIGASKGTFSSAELGRVFLLPLVLLLGQIAVGLLLVGLYFSLFFLYQSHPEWVPHMFLSGDPGANMRSLHEYGDLSAYLVLATALEVWMFCLFAVDVNLTSMHGYYRDRLASAFLIGPGRSQPVDIEDDIPLGELSCRELGSKGPYHLINVSLNLQSSPDPRLRSRRSDFFILSKYYAGGERTGYCRTALLEKVFPQIDLAAAMAISAAAASPNMGRYSSPALVAFMTLINVRLGVWIPHPGRLEAYFQKPRHKREESPSEASNAAIIPFSQVFSRELESIRERWRHLAGPAGERGLAEARETPTVEHNLTGVAFSGGGIRSATVNLGLAQALYDAGIFDYFDYMSTVSGGGYLGASISATMRCRVSPVSEIAGVVILENRPAGGRLVTVSDPRSGDSRQYAFPATVELAVAAGARVRPGDRLVNRPELPFDAGDTIDMDPQGATRNPESFVARFDWRVRPWALLREICGDLKERARWVNLSDGGHLENLGVMELLRRRCRVIVAGDGEADPKHAFGALATLMRTAEIDLGVEIEIFLEELRLRSIDRPAAAHFAIGRITYPGGDGPGYLIYVKSSVTGDENAIISEYRERFPSFPNESTADQFFSEDQFEAYRLLGIHIGEKLKLALLPDRKDIPFQFLDLVRACERLFKESEAMSASTNAPGCASA